MSLKKRKGKTYRVDKWKFVRFTWIKGLVLFYYSTGKFSGIKDPERYGHQEFLTMGFLIFRLEFSRSVMPLG